MKHLEIFGHTLARASADQRELASYLDRECSVPRFAADTFVLPVVMNVTLREDEHVKCADDRRNA